MAAPTDRSTLDPDRKGLLLPDFCAPDSVITVVVITELVAIVVTLARSELVIAVNIGKGKSWALEIAQAVSMLDPESAHLQLRERKLEGDRPPPPEGDAQSAGEPERLAA